MMDKFLIYGQPLIEEAEINEVVDSLRSGWLGTGPKTHKFERMFSQFKGVDYAIALNSCTAALHLSLLALGVGRGDEVIVPTMTFAATANAVIHAGAKPIFVDCDKKTMNIIPSEIEKNITSRTKAIIPVHFAGRPCDMKSIMEISQVNGLKVIEDCAHAVESEIGDSKLGTIGDIGCFSFYVTKNIVTGEGGMAITKNEELADKIKTMALHGLSKDAWSRFGDSGYSHYRVIELGYKYNMMDIQAAIGMHQLPRIQDYWERRRAIWNEYNHAFQGLCARTPIAAEKNTRHAYHLYTLMIDPLETGIDRDEFIKRMTQERIGVGVHYIALHLHPYYQNEFGYKIGDYPNAEWISERTVSLPLSPRLSVSDVSRVIKAVSKILVS